MKKGKYLSNSSEETIELGMKYAQRLRLKDVIGLQGQLGSGKTQFVKGIAKYFNVKGIVNSSTYLILNEYIGKDPVRKDDIKINHFDFYRIESINELDVLGFDDFINDNSICLIEWCELAEEYMNTKLKKVKLDYGDKENERIINI
jgi:tRNA threonylcarbamoyladenosine biosynthesis protein TsaE